MWPEERRWDASLSGSHKLMKDSSIVYICTCDQGRRLPLTRLHSPLKIRNNSLPAQNARRACKVSRHRGPCRTPPPWAVHAAKLCQLNSAQYLIHLKYVRHHFGRTLQFILLWIDVHACNRCCCFAWCIRRSGSILWNYTRIWILMNIYEIGTKDTRDIV